MGCLYCYRILRPYQTIVDPHIQLNIIRLVIPHHQQTSTKTPYSHSTSTGTRSTDKYTLTLFVTVLFVFTMKICF